MSSGIQRFDWRDLIAPFRPIMGTPRSDTLSALAEGDVVFGLDGGDRLSSTFTRTGLIGGRGRDSLTTTVRPEPVAPLHMLAVQLGERGNDRLQASLIPQGLVEESPGGDEVTAALYLDGGSGHDVITGRIDFDTSAPASATTLILGGSGNDTIDVAAGRSIAISSFGRSTTVNTIDGGDGHDRIMALARDFGSDNNPDSTEARNVVTGGNGNDIIDATADLRNLAGRLASNSLSGGLGDDILRAHARIAGGGDSRNELQGGAGDDLLEASIEHRRETSADVTNLLDGGSGHDTLRAFLDLRSGGFSHTPRNTLSGGDGRDDLTAGITGVFLVDDVTASNVLQGGRSSDTLSATINLRGSGPADVLNSLEGEHGDDTLFARLDYFFASFEGGLDNVSVLNTLTGGIGNDSLTAILHLSQPAGDPPVEPGPPPALAENRLEGGSGRDTLVGIVAPASPGASILTGGFGHDRLTVVGGTGNRLDGGDDRDTLTGGSGEDQLAGGEDIDTFRFNLTQDQGTDTLVDFNARREILSFAGLVDVGAPGLVDDLDRLSVVIDQGPGNDVLVDFDVFDLDTILIFEGRGTGAIDSWAELVANPAVQLRLEPSLI